MPHATKYVAFLGALRHRTRVDVSTRCLFEFQADGICRGDGTAASGCGSSSSSVCVDGWFILGAMMALHHRCAAPSQPETNQFDS